MHHSSLTKIQSQLHFKHILYKIKASSFPVKNNTSIWYFYVIWHYWKLCVCVLHQMIIVISPYMIQDIQFINNKLKIHSHKNFRDFPLHFLSTFIFVLVNPSEYI